MMTGTIASETNGNRLSLSMSPRLEKFNAEKLTAFATGSLCAVC